MSKQFHESETSRRANGFWEFPEAIFIPGLDADPKLGRPHKKGEHPGWQDPDDVERPLRLPKDPATWTDGHHKFDGLIRSIMVKGVVAPGLIDKDDDDRTFVSNGKRRTAGLRIANERLKAQGDPPKQMCYFSSRAQGTKSLDAGHTRTVAALSNEHAVANGPMHRIETAARMIRDSDPPAAVCAIYGITEDHLNAVWLPLYSASSEIKAMVNNRTITMTEAAKLMKLPAEKRTETVTRVVKAAEQAKAVAPKSKAVTTPEPQKTPGRAEKVAKPKSNKNNGKGRDAKARVERTAVKKAMGQVVAPGKRELREVLSYAAIQFKEARGSSTRLQFETAVDMLKWLLGESEKPGFLAEE